MKADISFPLKSLSATINALMPSTGQINLTKELKAFANVKPREHISEPAFLWLLDGSLEITLGKQKFSLMPGQVMITTMHLPAFYNVKSQSYLAVELSINSACLNQVVSHIAYRFDERESLETLTSFAKTSSSYEQLNTIERLVSLIQADCSDSYPYELLVKELYYYVMTDNELHDLISHYIVHHDHNMVNTINFMACNYVKDLEIAKLAHMADLSVSSFYSHFKALTALTPQQYLKRMRLLKARSLLKGSYLKANEVAWAVGYISEQHFSRDYSKFFGLPPKTDARRGKIS